MEKRIENQWRAEQGGAFEVASILQHEVHPEGLDLTRVRFLRKSLFTPARDHGALLSVLRGSVQLRSESLPALQLRAGTHLYMPAGFAAQMEGEPGTELALALSPKASRARGKLPLLRDEQFLAGCAVPGQALRWILTPQYLSRRVFLHHDRTLLSKSGDPVSWFHTTMFDVTGLPSNDEGKPVFKMSYNYRTEPNVCYQVEGRAGVRMALHPYSEEDQKWGPWHALDGETTYHLNEDSTQAQWLELATGREPRRNKHEVFVEGGFVSLMCIFDPAPTGVELHKSGAYSSYGDLGETLGTPRYAQYLRTLEPYEEMVQVLSLAKACGDDPRGKAEWKLFEEGRKAQREIEAALRAELVASGQGRERHIDPWMLR